MPVGMNERHAAKTKTEKIHMYIILVRREEGARTKMTNTREGKGRYY